MNNEVLEKVDEIIEYITNTELYKEYRMLEDKLRSNKKALTLIEEVKTIQKELVKLEISNKDTTLLNDKYLKTLKELEKIPLYQDYNNAVKELNLMYQKIKLRLDDYFYNKLN